MDHQQTQTCGIEMVYLIFNCFVDSEGSVLEVAASALALSLDAAAAFCDFAACKFTVAFQRRLSRWCKTAFLYRCNSAAVASSGSVQTFAALSSAGSQRNKHLVNSFHGPCPCQNFGPVLQAELPFEVN